MFGAASLTSPVPPFSPLRMMPCVDGIKPVKSDVRAGPQTEAGVKALLKRTPSFAKRSIFGVLTIW